MVMDVLITEMKLRRFSPKTMKAYLHWNERFLHALKKSPREVTQKDLDMFLLSLELKAPPTRHQATAALRFYYTDILRRKFHWRYPRPWNRLPPVLSLDKIRQMIDCTPNLKHRLMLELLYGSGLRVGEVIKLRPQDIEGNIAMICQGKGNKDRFAVLSQRFLADLHRYLRGREIAGMWLFPSWSPSQHITIRTVQEVVDQARRRAVLAQHCHPHMLRASFATHMIEQGTDISKVQQLMGHSDVRTTRNYLNLSKQSIIDVRSPLDNQSGSSE